VVLLAQLIIAARILGLVHLLQLLLIAAVAGATIARTGVARVAHQRAVAVGAIPTLLLLLLLLLLVLLLLLLLLLVLLLHLVLLLLGLLSQEIGDFLVGLRRKGTITVQLLDVAGGYCSWLGIELLRIAATGGGGLLLLQFPLLELPRIAYLLPGTLILLVAAVLERCCCGVGTRAILIAVRLDARFAVIFGAQIGTWRLWCCYCRRLVLLQQHNLLLLLLTNTICCLGVVAVAVGGCLY